MSLEFSTELSKVSGENIFTVTVDDAELRFVGDDQLVLFDGYSDFAQVAQNTINTLGSVIENRLSSIFNQEKDFFVDKINDR